MTSHSSSFWQRPSTRLGRWAEALAVVFAVMFIINSVVFMPLSGDAPWQHLVLPFYGILMILCGLGSGVLGALAVIRQRERSWLAWLALLPGAFMLFMLLGEFLAPH